MFEKEKEIIQKSLSEKNDKTDAFAKGFYEGIKFATLTTMLSVLKTHSFALTGMYAERYHLAAHSLIDGSTTCKGIDEIHKILSLDIHKLNTQKNMAQFAQEIESILAQYPISSSKTPDSKDMN